MSVTRRLSADRMASLRYFRQRAIKQGTCDAKDTIVLKMLERCRPSPCEVVSAQLAGEERDSIVHTARLVRPIWAKATIIGAAILLAACTMVSPSVDRGDRGGPPRLDGYRGQYTLLRPVQVARLTPFRMANGQTIDLSHFRGKVLLLNFWATWCAPCVYEMPSLNRLAAEMSGDKFAVVPIAIDRAGLSTVAPFYRVHGLTHLGIYLDPGRRTAYFSSDNPNDAEFALYGLPISYIVDHEGRVMGYIAGAVDWQSDAAKALIRYYTVRVRS